MERFEEEEEGSMYIELWMDEGGGSVEEEDDDDEREELRDASIIQKLVVYMNCLILYILTCSEKD